MQWQCNAVCVILLNVEMRKKKEDFYAVGFPRFCIEPSPPFGKRD